MRCETLKRKFRHCPGKPPELVHEERVHEEGDQQSSGPPSLFASPPSWGHFERQPSGAFPGHSDVDPFQMFQRMEQMMGSLFGGSIGPGPGMQLPPRLPPSQPPPSQQQSPQQQPPPRVRIYEA